MDIIRRIFVEKKEGFAIEADRLLTDLRDNLGIKELRGVRVFNRYDIAGLTAAEYARARTTILSEPPIDRVFEEDLAVAGDERLLAIEYLPGQYDQRADSAAQCIQIITLGSKPLIAAARVMLFKGPIPDDAFDRIKKYLVNPVDSRPAAPEKPARLTLEIANPPDVEVLTGFIHFSEDDLASCHERLGLAMSIQDLRFCRQYFKDEEKRDPSITEIRMLDTYWSDHCRHTTFETRLDRVEIEEGPLAAPIRQAYEKLLCAYDRVYGQGERDLTLMKMATMSTKEMNQSGQLTDQEVSGEINACSIVRPVVRDSQTEEWLIMFKNETHNHPTEIEPFGGAATCLGGAIRDPLSGRAFVFQAMRVTGSGDPRTPIKETLPGKLPQRKITTEAALGYSSYGNQVGVPTGQVTEIYHPGYVAKRMEVGAVIGAVPRKNVLRLEPQPGDVVILLGGRTGRDGIGGATGSSREHNEESIFTAGAEVQKGNAPEERKLQRLFSQPEVTRLIKRCNDFGAGGVSVAIGELAAGLDIDLDRVPKKYDGLDGTELALSESQERLAVVVAENDAARFLGLADRENLEATPLARVTGTNRLRMSWRGQKIIDISRAFIDTHGVRQTRQVYVPAPAEAENFFQVKAAQAGSAVNDLPSAWLKNLANLDIACQKGLGERFDGTVGGGTVLMPFGGLHQLTPVEAMAAKVPVLSGDTTTATLMAFGFNPFISCWSPFHGALYAVVEAVAKVTATGGDYRTIRTSLQEYFEKLGQDQERWGKPFAALLGAYHALTALGIPAIGGKDSMSGSFKDMDVPPTLIAFAVTTVDSGQVRSPEFKREGSPVVYVRIDRDGQEIPAFEQIRKNYPLITRLITDGRVLAAASVRAGGLAETISKMCLGNRLGFAFQPEITARELFSPDYGSIVLELACSDADIGKVCADLDFIRLGKTQGKPAVHVAGQEISLDDILSHWQAPLESVFPTRTRVPGARPLIVLFDRRNTAKPKTRLARPRVLIPVFPGTNCEFETERAFARAGAEVESVVFSNLSAAHITRSLELLRQKIDNAQIVVLPGGFTAGDEPDGSGKFIAAVFRNPRISEATLRLLKERDGLMLGICNGFQALIKLGLVPYGEIVDLSATSPTLTFNQVGRYVSCLVRTQVTSVLSPWFSRCRTGDIHTVTVSHGEGRFIAPDDSIKEWLSRGQVASQYVDLSGSPSLQFPFNPNGSCQAVEGIASPDGRVLGKMGHSERMGSQVAKNVPGNKDQQLFESGVDYFS